jgi:chaperonin cofactor prefoldin
MIRKISRLLNLRKLISIEDRIAALEAQGRDVQNRLRNHRKTLKNQSIALKNESNRLQEQGNKLRERIDSLQKNRIDTLQWRVRVLETKVERFDEQLDLLKSSLEVPQDLVEEFFEWKANTPIPARPLVTVAVATYNRARLLTERCIPSVFGQTYDNLELIVVGDGCTDETEEAVAEIRDPRLTFVNLLERGSYPADPMRRWMVAGTQALNKAMSMARGDFVTHLDDDDEYTPDRLEKLVEFAVENRCDFVWHPCWSEDQEGRWKLIEAPRFAHSQVTTSSVFYRSWFTNIEWNTDAHLLMEPGDWNRFRRIKFIGPVIMRYPEPLLKHYRQMNQSD